MQTEKRIPIGLAWLLVVVILTCVSNASTARPGDFQVIGPGGGGAMFHPTISPHDVNTVLIACDMTGAYITHDGGRSWRMFNLRGDVSFFVFDPLDPKTMYAHATGLWRSSDGGDSWTLVYPKPSTVRGVAMNSDHADEKILAEPDPLGTISALAIDPANSRVLYAAAGDKNSPALFISRDFGETWQQDATLPETPRHIWVDPHSPADSRILFIGSPHSIAVKTTSGVQKLQAPESVTFTDISLGFGSTAQPVIYATSEQGAFVSKDGAGTWKKLSVTPNGTVIGAARSLGRVGAAAKISLVAYGNQFPEDNIEIRAIATSLRHPETAYLSYSHLSLDGKEWLGVAKTDDTGAHWELVWKESDAAASNVHDAWITERFGIIWGENPLNLTVADQDANLAYGTDLGRTMLTTDGGANWNAVYSRKASANGWTTTGLDVTNAYGIHFDPFDSKRQFITYTDIGLFRSEDGGVSWTSSTAGVPRDWVNTTYWMVFDPKVRGRVWSVNSYTHDLPRPKMWRHNSVTTYKGGVCRSDDGGKTWSKSNSGMEETAATHILLDPTSPPDARVLYVTGFGRGVYKSVDGGKTWTLKNQGITQNQPFAWRLARSSDGTLYLILARRSENGSIGNDGDGAIYRSTDGAEHWQPVHLPSGTNGPNGLAIDPKSPRRLYLAAWARAQGVHGEGGGISSLKMAEKAGGKYLIGISTSMTSLSTQTIPTQSTLADLSHPPRVPPIVASTGIAFQDLISSGATG